MPRDLHPLEGVAVRSPRAARERGADGKGPLRAGAAALLIAGVLLVAGCRAGPQGPVASSVGGLVFAVDPPDAEIVLDGVARGEAAAFAGERHLEADRGTHRLEFRKPGYETYARDVYVSNSILRIEAALVERRSAPGGP